MSGQWEYLGRPPIAHLILPPIANLRKHRNARPPNAHFLLIKIMPKAHEAHTTENSKLKFFISFSFEN